MRPLTTCVYCGCGCGLYLISDGKRLTGAYPSRNHPISRGSLCVKGWNSHEFVSSPDRLTTPLLRRSGRLAPATWDEALDGVVAHFHRFLRRSGPESLAFLSSAKATNEENYLMMKLARAVFRTNNVDHCARLCHASTVVGLSSTFGSGAMTNSIEEIDEAEVVLVTGSDTTAQHPLIGSRIIKAVRDRGARLIVVDPREIALAKCATRFARPRCGTDVAWINGVMNVIIAEGLEDRAFIEERTEGFDALRDVVLEYTPDRVEEISGIPKQMVIDVARMYARARKAMIVYSMGITQHTTGVDNVMSLANLAMLTGHVGRASCGVNPLRGQNNVQGACDMGALPGVYSGYQKVGEEGVRRKFETHWGVRGLPAGPGLTVTEMVRAVGDGDVRGFYVMGENPAMTDPNANHVRACLRKAEFLVVQDLFLSETAEYADVVLPSASFAEKDGTFTNTERRVQRVRKVVDPPGQARPDWQILCEVGRRSGWGGMEYRHPSEIMEEIARLTPIYGGIDYARLDPHGLQWPCPSMDHPGTTFLHEGRFARGRGRFMPCRYRPPAEEPDGEYAFTLSTGRTYWHWHSGTMTRRTSTLEREVPEGYVEMHPADAEDLGVRTGDRVRVRSRRGSIEIRVEVTSKVARKSLFIPFHFKEAAANLLTTDALDPVAKIPEYKVCAAKVEKS